VIDLRSPLGVPSDPAALDAALDDIDWTAVPEGARRHTVDAPSGPLACLRADPPAGLPGGCRGRVLLVPGATGSKEDFARMIPLLARDGYRVEAFDMAGQYQSWGAGPEHLVPPASHYTDRLFADDLLAVIAAGPTPVHLVGYSYAGTVAALVASGHPGLVRSLTLLSSPPVSGQALRGFTVLGPLSWLVPGRAVGRLMVAALHLSIDPRHPSRARFVRARFALTRADSVADVLTCMKRTPDLEASLRATGVPILVAAGTHDIWTARALRAHARRLGAMFRRVRGGHTVCETAPHQLTAALLELFAEAESGVHGGL